MGVDQNPVMSGPSVDAVLSSLPSDAEQQLEVGLHVLRHAFRKKVKELETDNANMRQFGKEKNNQVVMLEQKVASLEGVVDDMTRRAKELAAENARVAAERDALAENVKKLTKDMKRLDHFKRSILNTIEDDDPAAVPSSTFSNMPEPASYMQPTSRTPPQSPPRGSTNATDLIAQIDRSIENGRSNSPSRFPDIANNEPAAPAASTGAAATVDGKEFFKKARHRLSFQKFNEFLANIKKLNSHLQTRDETLAKASEIFGPDNQDLHVAFTGLLSRHGV